jgi:hypothetical protein
MRQDQMLIIQFHAEHGVGQKLHHLSTELHHIFFGHRTSIVGRAGRPGLRLRRKMILCPRRVKRDPGAGMILAAKPGRKRYFASATV